MRNTKKLNKIILNIDINCYLFCYVVEEKTIKINLTTLKMNFSKVTPDSTISTCAYYY